MKAETKQIGKVNGSKAFIETALSLYKKSKKLKQVQDKYTAARDEAYREMSNFFFVNGLDTGVTFSAEDVDDQGFVSEDKVNYVVRKIQKTSVDFDADKLEKSIGKELSKVAITKSYQIIDMDKFIEYVRGLGADPNVIKGFISVTKKVDNAKLDNLDSLGLINRKQISGCYKITKGEPYFTVKKEE